MKQIGKEGRKVEQGKERGKGGRGVQERRKISCCIRLSAFLRETLYSLSQITPGGNKSLGFIPIAVKNALTKNNKGEERVYVACDFKLQPIWGGW